MYDIFLVSRKSIDDLEWSNFKSRFPRSQKIENIKSINDIKNKSLTKFFWIVWDDLIVDKDFNLDYRIPKWDEEYIHVFKNGIYYDGICIISKDHDVSDREFKNRFFSNKKEIDIVASYPRPFNRYKISSYEEYQRIVETSTTNMFWIIWDDIIVSKNFNFEFQIPYYDQHITHIFKNKDFFDGMCLMSKSSLVTKKEFDHRFFINKKEIDIVASIPKPYDKFVIDTYDDYLQAFEKSTTDMFWMLSNNLEIDDDFTFDLYFSYHNSYDRNENHAFIHKVNDTIYYNGIFLLSKKNKVTKKEIEHRFLINKKEWDIVASRPCTYDVFVIDSWEDYQQALINSKTEMFYMSSNNIQIDENFKFDLYFTHDNLYDRKQNHVFVHLVNGKEYYNGLFLLSKHKPLSKKEIEHRFLIDKKIWTIVASGPKEYDKFIIDTYEDYLEAVNKSKTEFFYMIPKELEISDNFKFDFYFTHDNIYDRQIHHSFKNIFRNEQMFNGITLVCKKIEISKKEINYRSILNRKEYDIVATKLKPYDVIFISYNEKNADDNFERLKSKCFNAKRVHGIKGIHNAHIKAAELSETEMFWVVDGDAFILDDFNFDYEVSRYDVDCVHIWKSQNPINNLIYGYGGVKLLPKKLVLELDVNSTDMTMAISPKMKVMPNISNITKYDTDEFSVWKSAFRECVKLSSKIVDKDYQYDAINRLEVWCNYDSESLYNDISKKAAILGKEYGEKFSKDKEKLNKINDYDWLYSTFKGHQ